MQSENVYIGDDKFQKFLDHYNCPTPLLTVKLKFAGAISSPNPDLRPTDVIASLFYEDNQPRLVTKKEAELFFKFFMGLWDEMFIVVRTNTLKLPAFSGDKSNKDALSAFCNSRANAVELGFVEGFWGGLESLNIPKFAAELISSLSDLAGVYTRLSQRLDRQENPKDVYQVMQNTDQTVEKTLSFLIEHFVLPHIEKLQRVLN